MKEALQEKIAAGIHGRSANPRAHQNGLDADWQAGYLIGCCSENVPELWQDHHPITVEWKRRGSSEKLTPQFKSWKEGFWAGTFRKILDK